MKPYPMTPAYRHRRRMATRLPPQPMATRKRWPRLRDWIGTACLLALLFGLFLAAANVAAKPDAEAGYIRVVANDSTGRPVLLMVSEHGYYTQCRATREQAKRANPTDWWLVDDQGRCVGPAPNQDPTNHER